MPPKRDKTGESPPLEPIRFEEGDLHALSGGLDRDPQYDDRRLVLKRKLAVLGRRFAELPRRPRLPLESRTSLHRPHAFNGNRVRRMWAYACRDRGEKARLRKIVGAELARDLDAAYRNAYFCLAVEAEAIEVSLRIHPDAWFDGQNLAKRVAAQGPRPLLEILNRLEGHRLRLADWKGEWRCGELGPESLEEFFRYFEPGTHTLSIERRWPAPAAQPEIRRAAFAEEVPGTLLQELERLVPAYRYAAWSKESEYLFG